MDGEREKAFRSLAWFETTGTVQVRGWHGFHCPIGGEGRAARGGLTAAGEDGEEATDAGIGVYRNNYKTSQRKHHMERNTLQETGRF